MWIAVIMLTRVNTISVNISSAVILPIVLTLIFMISIQGALTVTSGLWILCCVVRRPIAINAHCTEAMPWDTSRQLGHPFTRFLSVPRSWPSSLCAFAFIFINYPHVGTEVICPYAPWSGSLPFRDPLIQLPAFITYGYKTAREERLGLIVKLSCVSKFHPPW